MEGFNKGYRTQALAAAVLVLTFLNPYALWDVGFQLSFAATMGMVLYTRPLEEYMQKQPEDKTTLADVAKASGDTLEILTAETNEQPAPEPQEEEQIIFEEPPPIEDEYSQPVPDEAADQIDAAPESELARRNENTPEL